MRLAVSRIFSAVAAASVCGRPLRTRLTAEGETPAAWAMLALVIHFCMAASSALTAARGLIKLYNAHYSAFLAGGEGILEKARRAPRGEPAAGGEHAGAARDR